MVHLEDGLRGCSSTVATSILVPGQNLEPEHFGDLAPFSSWLRDGAPLSRGQGILDPRDQSLSRFERGLDLSYGLLVTVGRRTIGGDPVCGP